MAPADEQHTVDEPQQAPGPQQPPVAFPLVGEKLEVDDAPDAAGAALGDGEHVSVATTTTPPPAPVASFRVENGRRYHAFDASAYALPNDDVEIGRLDIQHHVWRLCLGGRLHLAPLGPAVADVVDIGTGTGQWAVEFAEVHPEAQVLGTDLSPIQAARAPENCSFVIANAEDEWAFGKKFDFVRSRMLLFGMHDWERYFKQTFESLKPGGWMEVHEPEFPLCCANDGNYKKNPLWLWSQYISDAGKKTNIDTMVTERFRDMLEKQGFVNIRHQGLQWPQGPWAKGEKEKVIGKWMQLNTARFLAPIAMSWYSKFLGWPKEDIEAFLEDVKKDMHDPSTYYFWQLHIYSAQKPEEAV